MKILYIGNNIFIISQICFLVFTHCSYLQVNLKLPFHSQLTNFLRRNF